MVGVTGAIGLTGAVCGGLLGTNIDRGSYRLWWDNWNRISINENFARTL